MDAPLSTVGLRYHVGDGTPDTIVTAAALAAQQDAIPHVYSSAGTDDITVGLAVNGGGTYTEVGSTAVTVDATDTTTTSLVASSTSTTFGDTVTLTATFPR